MDPLGQVYTPLMQSYGTPLVAGVSPGYGGQYVNDLVVYDMVEQAIAAFGEISTSVVMVPPYHVMDSVLEAIAAGIQQIVIITEGTPPLDMVNLIRKAEQTETLIVGPNSPGVIIPGKILLGTHPTEFYTPGRIGLISRSGTLTYEVALTLTRAGLGQSIAVGIGGDPIIGSSYLQWLQLLDEDDETDAIVLIGEIEGDGEIAAASYIAEAIDKPVVAYIPGRTAPIEQFTSQTDANYLWRTADAAIASCTAMLEYPHMVDYKIQTLQQAGIAVATQPADIPKLIQKNR